MVEIIVAVAGIAFLLKLARCRHHRGRHHGHWPRPGSGGPGGGRGRRGWRGDGRDHIEEVLDVVDATPAQEKVIREQLAAFHHRARVLRDERDRTREDLAAVMRSEGFDENLLGEMFARHDDVLRDLRRDGTEALAMIHAVLTESQRSALARLLGTGRPLGFGPYRTSWA